jgi:GNAT superfamily N-acetyltransferase
MPFSRDRGPPENVDLGTDDFVVVQRDGAVVLAELADGFRRQLDVAGVRSWQLRVYEWVPRAKHWVLEGWIKGLWDADRGEFFIADLEVFPNHRNRGHGTRLLLACIEVARRLGAATITGELSDVDEVDRLAEWYPRFGFDVMGPLKPGTVARIRRTLRNDNRSR